MCSMTLVSSPKAREVSPLRLSMKPLLARTFADPMLCSATRLKSGLVGSTKRNAQGALEATPQA